MNLAYQHAARILLHKVDDSVEIAVAFDAQQLTAAVGLDDIRALICVGIDKDLVLVGADPV